MSMLNERHTPKEQLRVARWTWFLPLIVGTALAAATELGFLRTVGVLELGLAVILGVMVGEAPFRTGALLILPLAAPVLVLAAFASAGTFALSAIATAVLTTFNGLLAATGVMVRDALTTSPDTRD
jgi:hypothetical protein